MSTLLSNEIRAASKSHWEEIPCGINLPLGEVGTREFFENLRRFKYEVDYPEIIQFVRFPEGAGKRVLEVGCGLGSDSQTWCEAGAKLTAIDFAEHAVNMTKYRLEQCGLPADVRQASALNLPFEDNSFDVYYSWGVLMHTGGTQKALDEAFRVLVPGGEAIVMLYHKNSLQYRFYVQILGRKFDDGAPIASFIRGLKWISSAGCSSLPNGRLTIFFGRMYPAWERSCRRNSRSY